MTRRADIVVEAISGTFCAEDVWNTLRSVPADQPLIWLGSNRSAYCLLALAWDEIEPESFWRSRPLRTAVTAGLPWTTGTLCLVSYDAFNPWCERSSAPVRCFRIRRSLVIDTQARRAFICQEPGADRCQWQLSDPRLWIEQQAETTAPSIVWQALRDEAHYMQLVERARGDIRAGRYYQINLLRYWQTRQGLSRCSMIERLRRWSGPYAALLDGPDFGILSFSPERFFHLETRGRELIMRVAPIKGTRPVQSHPDEDARERDDLARHPKDRAELSMIIDLMRNDLYRMARPGGVHVVDPGTVHSFANVHHLIGVVEASLRSDLSWGDIARALCPGGSITGAPKREVMLAIREYEQRERGYLMGHLIYVDAQTGRADASILIRTAVRLADGMWEFAAGSGLVIHSQPEEEAAEVQAKARVILADP